jgi:hypothetical protein
MGIVGDLNKYTQFQTANAMEQAAQNPGGGASEGIGMGMGFGMANQMAKAQFTAQPAAGGAATPPPLPPADAYHVAIDGKQSGPFTKDVLKNMVMQNTLSRDTLVWKQGMASWSPAGTVSDLTDVFGAVPPPLPQQ